MQNKIDFLKWLKVLLILLFFSCNALKCQNLKDSIIKTIYNNRLNFHKDSIPNKYKNKYELLNKMSNISSYILDSVERFSKIEFNPTDSFFLLEGISNVAGCIYGYIWNSNVSVFYNFQAYPNFDKVINVKVNPYLDELTDGIMSDIEKWDARIHNRSFINSSVTDGLYFICSKVKLGSPEEIETIAFYEYDPKQKFIFTKEKTP